MVDTCHTFVKIHRMHNANHKLWTLGENDTWLLGDNDSVSSLIVTNATLWWGVLTVREATLYAEGGGTGLHSTLL